MKKAKIIIITISLLAFGGAGLAYKIDRLPTVLYQVDNTNPNPAQRICTKNTTVPYTTQAILGHPGITTLPYYTTTVASTKCPTTRLYEGG